MANTTYNWSDLNDGDVFGVDHPTFDPETDEIHFDDIDISAAEVVVGGDETTATFSVGSTTVTLDIPFLSIATANVSFADGSGLIVGDDATGVIGDDDSNTLNGTGGDDQLIGADGDDTISGGNGADVIDGGEGNDSLSGGAGIDTLLFAGATGPASVDLSIDTSRATLSLEGERFAQVYDATNPIVGSWLLEESGNTIVITFLSNGQYFLAEDGDPVADPSGQDGMERGTYTWDAGTDAFSFTTTVNTNGEWGLSHSLVDEVSVAGDSLTADDNGELIVFTRVTGDPLAGGWFFTNAGEAQSSGVITFLNDGRYMMAEDGNSVLDPSGQDGMERGTWTWDPGTDAFSSTTLVDTSGEWGFSHDPVTTISYHNGSDTVLDFENVEGSAFNDEITGDAGDNVLNGGDGADLISGGAGNDTLRGNGGPDTLSGGDGQDRLFGGGGSDSLQGGANSDRLIVSAGTESGLYGNDTLNGGGGRSDRVIFNDAESGVVINMGSETQPGFLFGSITGGDASSTLKLIGIEAVSGTEFNDTFNLSAQIQVNGLRTDIVQRFEGGDGADTISGESGNGVTVIAEYRNDVIFVGGAVSGIIANLDQQNAQDLVVGDETIHAGTVRDGYGNVDSLGFLHSEPSPHIHLFVDGIVGSMHDDYIRGGAFANTISGNTLQIFEGLAGDDTIIGGFDHGGAMASYESSTSGVIVNLSGVDTVIGGETVEAHKALDGFGGIDSLSEVDHVRGSEHADTLIGGSDDEEHFEGLGGNDLINGGAEFDNVYYTQSDEAVLIDLANGIGRGLADSVTGGSVGIDSLIDIEAAHGSDFADSILGGGAGAQPPEGEPLESFEDWEIGLFYEMEELEGFAGNDTIDGGDTGAPADENPMDIALYRGAPSAVFVNLSNGMVDGVAAHTARDGYGVNGNPEGTDILIDIGGAQGSRFDDTLIGGDGDDYLMGGFGNDSIRGGAGNDWLSYDFGNGVSVDLATGTATEFQGGGTLPSVDHFIEMENVLGSSSNDTLGGDGGDNTIAGGEDDDILRQTRGHDSIDGGEGFNDRLEFSAPGYNNGITYGTAASSVHVDLGAGTSDADRTGFMSGGVLGNDTASLANIEIVFGTAGHDILTGGSFVLSNTDTPLEAFRGGAGNDIIDGAGTSDNKGRGFLDRVEYGSSTSGVTVNLKAGTAADGLGGTDTLININWVTGSDHNDVLTGGNSAYDFFERFEGRGGRDTINGGTGTDDASYITSKAGVIVNLGTGIASDGWGSTDTLISIERVRGSDHDDLLIGSNDTSVIEMFIGEEGNDTINGGAGIDFAAWRTTELEEGGVDVFIENGGGEVEDGFGTKDKLSGIEGLDGSNAGDTLRGGEGGQWFRGRGGSDMLDGGADIDTADYSTDLLPVIVNMGGTELIIDLGDGEEAVASGTARDGMGGDFGTGGVDTLANIENVLGSVGDDHITGSGEDNLLDGNQGGDTLDGGAGNDTLLGGAGSGNDSLVGGDDNDTLDGGAGSDTLEGGDGNDTFIDALGNDSLDGGAGADTFFVNYKNGTVNAAGGADGDLWILNPDAKNVTYHVTDFDLSGTDRDLIDVGELLNASAQAGFYTGQAVTGFLRFQTQGDNKLLQWNIDGSGSDWITMLVLDGLGAQAVGTSSFKGFVQGTGGNDTRNGTAGDDLVLGLAGNDKLTTGAGNDQLFGGDGADIMTGGTGADTYEVDNIGDKVVETTNVGGLVLPGSGEGAAGTSGIGDTVIAAINYALGNFVENIVLTGAAARATGNTLANLLVGNAGTDTLVGGSGNDTLDGGTGSDNMDGGTGNDVYFVDATGDLVVKETATGGSDTIHSSVTIAKLANYIEHLVLIGSGVINGTGNTLSNSITGNAKNNRLTGDTGNDTLNGGIGGDTLSGGAGNDLYIVDAFGAKGDKIIGETATGGTDTVQSSVTRTGPLENFVEHVVLTGNFAINASGNSLANKMTGNGNDNSLSGGDGKDTLVGGAGNDTLNGGTGADSMNGGDGNDVYFVDVGGLNGDKIVGETATGGTDTVFSSATTYTLGGTLENLGLIDDAGNINGIGNGLSNIIAGSNGKNTLNGLGGDDVIDGGLETDQLNGGAGNDSLAGGDGNDTLDGGDDNDTIDGGLGADQLAGGAGDDVMIWAGNDSIDGGENTHLGDTLVVMGGGVEIDLSSANIANFEVIDLTGSGNNKLTVTAEAILSQSDSTNSLTVNGNDGDEVHFDDPTDWQESEDPVMMGELSYHMFTHTNGATLFVQTAIDTTGLS